MPHGEKHDNTFVIDYRSPPSGIGVVVLGDNRYLNIATDGNGTTHEGTITVDIGDWDNAWTNGELERALRVMGVEYVRDNELAHEVEPRREDAIFTIDEWLETLKGMQN